MPEKEDYEKSYSELENSLKELKELEEQLNETDKKHHLIIIENLEKQLGKVNEISEKIIERFYHVFLFIFT